MSADNDPTANSQPSEGPAPSAPGEPSMAGTIGENLAAAAKRKGLSEFTSGETPSGRALLAAMGGVRGLCETIVPGLVFLVVYTFTTDVPISLAASVGIAVIFTIVRLVMRSQPTQAIAGLIGVGASAILALITGKGTDNFILGLIINAVYALVILISVFVRWPLMGLAVGFLMGDGLAWRRDKAKYRAMQILTLCWFALFAVRLAVELPLYFANNVGGLALVKLLMGVPLYATLLLLSWLMVRSVYELKPTEQPQ